MTQDSMDTQVESRVEQIGVRVTPSEKRDVHLVAGWYGVSKGELFRRLPLKNIAQLAQRIRRGEGLDDQLPAA